jgi:hypothetical protein
MGNGTAGGHNDLNPGFVPDSDIIRAVDTAHLGTITLIITQEALPIQDFQLPNPEFDYQFDGEITNFAR